MMNKPNRHSEANYLLSSLWHKNKALRKGDSASLAIRYKNKIELAVSASGTSHCPAHYDIK